MKDGDHKKPGKLENDALWRETCDLVEFMYARLDEFPEEERWATASKLRHAANDLLNVVGLEAGNPGPIGAEYGWKNARKFASGLKTMYRFAGRQKFIDLDPAIMIRLDKLIHQIDLRIDKETKRSESESRKVEAERQKDVNAWREKHRLWKEMNR